MNFDGVFVMEKKGSGGLRPTAFLAVIPALFLLAPAAAQAPALAMLDQLERGEWELRFRDGTPTRKICLRTGRELLQLKHSNSGCSQYVVDDKPNEVTVQYTCPGKGYGLTNIRMETGGLAQIKGSGLVVSRAFDFTAEARRTGSCR
jgi:hypothetical protein